MDLIKARLDKMEATNRHLADELDNLKGHSMKYNLIFNLNSSYTNGKEAQGVNCVEIVQAFLRSIMGVDSSKFLIAVAHRIGKRYPDKSRPILAKLPVASDIDAIMRNTMRLRDTNHFISRQMTARQRERKQFVLPKFASLKQDRSTKARLSGKRLYVNGSLQTQYLPPTLYYQILRILVILIYLNVIAPLETRGRCRPWPCVHTTNCISYMLQCISHICII